MKPKKENKKSIGEEFKFQTYKQYLLYLSKLIEKEYKENLEKLAEKTKEGDIERIKEVEVFIPRIKDFLFNAWNMEINFLMPSQIIENTSLTKFSNNWSPIQAYYSVFLGLRALYLASGYNLRDTHKAALTFTSFYVKKNIFPFPWNCYCDGQKDLGNLSFKNFRKKRLQENIRTLKEVNQDYFEDVYAKFLRTTREKEYEKRKQEYRKKEKIKRVVREQGLIIDRHIPSTTFLDCLYRLRKRSDYDEAEGLLLSEVIREDTIEFYESLRTILESTLFILENLIRKHIGKDRFNEIVREFVYGVFKIYWAQSHLILFGQQNTSAFYISQHP
jgi:hypothetical protein